MSARRAAAALELPDRTAAYAIGARLGAGGMGTVHRATRRDTGEDVAIKRLPEHAEDDRHLVHILRDEARLQRLVRSPHVVRTEELCTIGGRLALVLELVDGPSLARWKRVRRGPFALETVSEIGVQLLEGLAAAHEARGEDGAPLGLVHRDVTPHNVLVGRDGLVKIADFGVARATERAQTTEEGRIKGKLGYLAPEQVEGGPLDARTDLFAVGVVLWELVAGRALFAGPNAAAVMQAVLRASPPPLVEVRRELEGATPRARRLAGEDDAALEALEAVLRRALARDVAERFPTARLFADALVRATPRASAERLADEVAGISVVDDAAERLVDPFGATAVEDAQDGERAATESLVRGTTAPRGRRSRSPAVVALGAGILGGVAVAVALVASHLEGASDARALAAAEGQGPDAAALPGPEAGGDVPDAAARATATGEPPAEDAGAAKVSTGADAAAPSTGRATSGSAGRAHGTSAGHGAATARPSSTAAGCDPPYRVDARGVKIFRPECL